MFERFHLPFLYLLTNERTSHLRNTVVVCPLFSVEAIKQPHMVCFPLVPLCPEPYLLEHWSWASVEAVPLLCEKYDSLAWCMGGMCHESYYPSATVPTLESEQYVCFLLLTIWLKYKCVSKATFYHRDSKYFLNMKRSPFKVVVVFLNVSFLCIVLYTGLKMEERDYFKLEGLIDTF